MNFIYKLKKIFLDILFPPICLNCKNNLQDQEKDGKICRKCLGSIQIYSSLFCPKCKSRVPGEQKTCHKEIKFLLAPVTDYRNPPVKNLIWFLKYHKWQSIIQIIKPLIDRYLDILSASWQNDLSNFIIISIPLHSDRFKERGFNQSELIAEIVSQKIKASLIKNNLKRIKATKNQAELKNVNERLTNIENCFVLNDPKEISGKNIILVDDVFTSGSTMSEAVKVLKQAGAKKIIGFVFAKA